MTNTGHNALVGQIVENLKKRATHTEVRAETLPPELAEIVTEMAHQVARINLELIDAKQRLAAIEALEIDKRLIKGAA